jgi:hypothetical protein
MKKYIYKEINMTKTLSLIDQLNEEGEKGWRFKVQAQRITPNKFQLSGQPQIDMVIIYEKEIIVPEEIKN